MWQCGNVAMWLGAYGRYGKKQALKGVSFELYEGQIFALLGHNGAGKSTMHAIVSGHTNPTAGPVAVYVSVNLIYLLRPVRIRYCYGSLAKRIATLTHTWVNIHACGLLRFSVSHAVAMATICSLA
jgi:ABC-type branched-subunit amino acid transport system ATPase component